jgi:hypothetical protein
MFGWAADPEGGNLLPAEFRNPFRRFEPSRRQPTVDLFGSPDISTAMAVDLLASCDAFQLPLFSTLVLFGLRAAEPIYVFRELIDECWMQVGCLSELGHLTKGKRDKRFPIPCGLLSLWKGGRQSEVGLVFTRRGIAARCPDAPLYGSSVVDLGNEFRTRCAAHSESTASARQTTRENIIREAGGLNYDQIEHEFQALARRLGWPRKATLKDLRHLFATNLENSGVGQYYRVYLLGQSPGRTPIATYTHINELRAQFQTALDQSLRPIVDAIERRGCELSLLS